MGAPVRPWAVVAGGSEGVGAEFAAQLAAAGVNLVLIARKPEPLRQTADRCRARRARPGTRPDLSGGDAAARVIEATSDLEVGLLIYNAGANTHSAAFLDGDLAAFGGVLALNVTTRWRSFTTSGARCVSGGAAVCCWSAR